MNVYYWRTWYKTVCGGERGKLKVKDMCSGILLAAACVDESDYLALVNAGDLPVLLCFIRKSPQRRLA